MALIYLLAAPSLPFQTRDQAHLNDANVHRLAESTAALMYTALLSSVKQLPTSSFQWLVELRASPVALENWWNELCPDPVYVLATGYSSLHTARSCFLVENDGFVPGFILILNSTNFERRDLGFLQNIHSLCISTEFAPQKGKAPMETNESLYGEICPFFF